MKQINKSSHHSKANIGHLEGWPIIGAITCNSHHLSIGTHCTLNDAFHQCVLIGGRWSGQHTKVYPHLIHELLLHLIVGNKRKGSVKHTLKSLFHHHYHQLKCHFSISIIWTWLEIWFTDMIFTTFTVTHLPRWVSDSSVELLSFQDETIVTLTQNAAFWGNGACGVDIVTSDHAHGDARPLALMYGIGHFWPHWVLNAQHTKAGQVADDVVLIIPDGLILKVHLMF